MSFEQTKENSFKVSVPLIENYFLTLCEKELISLKIERQNYFEVALRKRLLSFSLRIFI